LGARDKTPVTDAVHKGITELKAVFGEKDKVEYDRITSEAIFNELNNTLVPKLVEVNGFDADTDFTTLKSAFTVLKSYKTATDADKKKA